MVLLGAVLVVPVGCATRKIDWESRIGTFTYDDAIRELGPPDKSADLSDGTRVADWTTMRGMRTASTFGGWYPYGPHGYLGPNFIVVDPPAPDRILRLTFDSQGKLASWRKMYR